MNVIHNPRARRAAQIYADVKAGRLVRFAKRRLAALRQIHQFVCGFFPGSIQLTDVLVGNYEQMAGDVRIDIENDETVRSAVDNEIGFVVTGVVAEVTENAALCP
jgi:hypothetical protein